MDSQTWRQIGRGALAGAVAGAALAAMGLRIGPNGALRPAPVRTTRRPSPRLEPPFDALEPPASRREETRAVVTQAATGAALGALFGYLRSRADRAESAVETGLYGILLSTLGLGAWLAPLGLVADEDGISQDEPADDETFVSHGFPDETRPEDFHPPYEDQPPYDPEAPFDVF